MDITITTDVLLNEMQKYTPFTAQVFDYLNPRISPRNPCSLMISVYNPYNYGEFRKPNIINIPLGSIINNFYGRDSMIKFVIILSICHELHHANQLIDMIRYSYDKEYRETLEQQAEYSAEQFLINNSTEIKRLFGVNPYRMIASKTSAPATPYEEFDYESYYINTLVDVVYRNSEVIPKLREIFDRDEDCYSNLYISFSENGRTLATNLIRHHWRYLPDSLPNFNAAVNLFRVGTAPMKYNTKTVIKIAPGPAAGENAVELSIDITDKTYEPIGFF